MYCNMEDKDGRPPKFRCLANFTMIVKFHSVSLEKKCSNTYIFVCKVADTREEFLIPISRQDTDCNASLVKVFKEFKQEAGGVINTQRIKKIQT